MTAKPRSIFLLAPENLERIYNAEARRRVSEMTENDGTVHSAESILAEPVAYADVELVFSGWGAPELTGELLDRLPRLRAFFYGAGSVRAFVTETFWEREIVLTSAYQANAVPVAEYTMASVIFALKRAWRFDRGLKAGVDPRGRIQIAGVYEGSRVGIISLGAIGRLVCEKLVALELDVLAYDPLADASAFERLGVQRAESLEQLFPVCDVVSLHAPWLKETENLVTGDLLRSMKADATFINTSRGAIVDEPAMIEVLRERPDLFAVLDLIQDESNYAGSPLREMPNVFLTPHIAGSQGRECHRMGALAVEECRRFLAGEPQLVGLNQQRAAILA